LNIINFNWKIEVEEHQQQFILSFGDGNGAHRGEFDDFVQQGRHQYGG